MPAKPNKNNAGLNATQYTDDFSSLCPEEQGGRYAGALVSRRATDSAETTELDIGSVHHAHLPTFRNETKSSFAPITGCIRVIR